MSKEKGKEDKSLRKTDGTGQYANFVLMRNNSVVILRPILIPRLEAAILLISSKNRDLSPVPIFQYVQSIRSAVFSQSDWLDLKISQSIADFRYWERPEVSILGAVQNLPKDLPLGTRMSEASLGQVLQNRRRNCL